MMRLTLTIRPEPAGDDRYGRAPEARLKLLLKTMLRLYGWRCERIEGENRPPRIAPAASEGIGPTLDPSEQSTRQRGDTAAGESEPEKIIE